MPEAGEGAQTGFRPAAARVAASAMGLLRARLELAGLELAEERERLLARAVLLFAGVLLVLFGLLGLEAFVVVLFWDTHRIAAILGCALGSAALGGALLWRAYLIGRDGPMPFAATCEEFDKDRMTLAGRSEAPPVATGVRR